MRGTGRRVAAHRMVLSESAGVERTRGRAPVGTRCLALGQSLYVHTHRAVISLLPLERTLCALTLFLPLNHLTGTASLVPPSITSQNLPGWAAGQQGWRDGDTAGGSAGARIMDARGLAWFEVHALSERRHRA